MGQKISEEVYEQIVTEAVVYGRAHREIAEKVGLNKSTVTTTVKAFSCVRDKNFIELIDTVRSGCASYYAALWAAKKLNVSLPKQAIDEAYEDLCKRQREQAARRYTAKKKAKEPAPQPVQEAEPETPLSEKTDSQETQREIPSWNERLYLCKIIESLVQQNELLTQLMDNVLPHWTADIKDSINVNCDVIAGELKTCKEALDAIRCNTRKRGL